MKNKNIKLSIDFERYCKAHPEERFWQALQNWAEVDYIKISNPLSYELGDIDTFYFNDKNK